MPQDNMKRAAGGYAIQAPKAIFSDQGVFEG